MSSSDGLYRFLFSYIVNSSLYAILVSQCNARLTVTREEYRKRIRMCTNRAFDRCCLSDLTEMQLYLSFGQNQFVHLLQSFLLYSSHIISRQELSEEEQDKNSIYLKHIKLFLSALLHFRIDR